MTSGPGHLYDEDKSSWANEPAIADPTGGATVDAQARAAIVSILVALREAGIIATD